MRVPKSLTASRIKLAKVGGKEVWLSDDTGLRGMGRLWARVSAMGVVRFYFRFTLEGKRSSVPLGPYSRTAKLGFLTIDQARAAAGHLAYNRPVPGEPKPGVPASPTEPKASSAESNVVAPSFTVMDLCNAYAEKLQLGGKISAKEVRQVFQTHVASSRLASLPATAVTSREFADLLGEIVSAGHGRTAGKVRAYLHAAYSAAKNAKLAPVQGGFAKSSAISFNPISDIPALNEFNKARRRSLGRAELRALWSVLNPASDGSLSYAERIVRLDILLGGQRCEQLLRAQVVDADLEGRTLLLEDPKGKRSFPRPHLLPLVPAATKDVRWFLEHSADIGSEFLFPGTKPKTAYTSSTVSKTVASISKALLETKLVVAPFSYCDFRRTIETTLASLGVGKDTLAHLLSHGLSGVQNKHYNLYEYLEEKKSALLILEEHLATLIKNS